MTTAGMPDGTGAISTADAVETLLGQAPVDQASETPEELEAETEEVEASSEEEVDDEAGEEAQAEAETDDDDEVEEVDETLYAVKVDGEESEVTIDDLVKNYQLESTAQRRLSDAAQQRKQVDVDRTALAQERERYAQGLQQIAATLEAQQPDESSLDTLKEEDPFAYQEQKVAQLERAEAMRRVAAEQQGLHQQKIAEEGALLMERIPEWRDADVRVREQSAIVTYAKRVGFSDQELAQASDSRAIEVLRKAHLYDELVKNQVPRAKKKVAQAKKMVKGGQPKTQKQVASESQRKAYERFAKRGSTEAAVDYLLSKS